MQDADIIPIRATTHSEAKTYLAHATLGGARSKIAIGNRSEILSIRLDKYWLSEA